MQPRPYDWILVPLLLSNLYLVSVGHLSYELSIMGLGAEGEQLPALPRFTIAIQMG